MSTTYERLSTQVRAASGLNILLGLWLILAPWALAYSVIETATWNSVIVGLAVTLLAAIRLANPLRFEALSWLNFALGLWLILSPFLLNFQEVDSAMWNSVVVGLIILVPSAWSAAASKTQGHAPENTDRPDL